MGEILGIMITRKELSNEQESALQAMLAFLRGSEQQMVLSGYAGTGKSSLINVFLIEAKKYNKYLSCYCTAPTNEAVRVISSATGNQYDMTIYSLLGLVLIEESGLKPRLTQKGKPKINDYDVIILDEASMVGDELLVKIYEQLKKFPHVKIIYVGDSAQLPPINTSDEIFNKNSKGAEQTESSIFKLSNTVQLVEVQRVAKGNPIINVVTPIRMNLSSKIDCFDRDSHFDGESGIQFFSNSGEFMDLMFEDFMSEKYRKNNNYTRVIAYTNNVVNKLNRKIRMKIFDNEAPDEYIVGEVLIIASPVFQRVNKFVKEIALTTGERVLILNANLTVDVDYGMNLWELCVKKYDESDDKNYTIWVIAKDSEESYLNVLSGLAEKAKLKLSQTVVRDGKVKSLYSAQEAWSEYYNFKDNYCRLKYSYAMTTHTSQGATIERAYVIERDLNILSWNDIIRNKLKYTAFTRASKLLRVLM